MLFLVSKNNPVTKIVHTVTNIGEPIKIAPTQIIIKVKIGPAKVERTDTGFFF